MSPSILSFARIAAPVLVLSLSLSACESARRALGYEKAPPDEFQVVQRAPLSMPPDFTLRPPVPGLVRPQEGNPRDQAKTALQGGGKVRTPSAVGRDLGDIELLKRAGAENASPEVRDLVDKETLAQANADQGFTEKLVFWSESQKPTDREQIDPNAESQRLRANQALARGVTDGKTPRIEKDNSSTFGSVFGWVPWPF